MRVFVAGSTGVIGRSLLPMLLDAGHGVTGTTRVAERATWLESIGVRPAVVDVYDAGALRKAMLEAQPDAVIHQLTDLARGFSPEALVANARLREEGTANLVAAAEAAGAHRLVAQSIAWLYADGPLPHDESQPLRSPTAGPQDVTLRGVLALERLVLESRLEALVLRYGALYGAGANASEQEAAVPRVSVDAAARAALLAVEHGSPGAYNVVDDNDLVSNGRARKELGWSP